MQALRHWACKLHCRKGHKRSNKVHKMSLHYEILNHQVLYKLRIVNIPLIFSIGCDRVA